MSGGYNKDNKDNNENVQIYYLCNDTDSDKDNYCKKLIEMINVIVLNTLLKDPYYIKKSNQLALSVINSKTNELNNKLTVNPDTKAEYDNYRENEMQATSKSIEEFEGNLYNNGVGQNMGSEEGMEGMEHGILSNAMEHLPHDIPHNIPHHIPPVGGNRRKSNKKTHKKSKTYKKSKRIRKI